VRSSGVVCYAFAAPTEALDADTETVPGRFIAAKFGRWEAGRIPIVEVVRVFVRSYLSVARGKL
jgi:hypothetical protein